MHDYKPTIRLDSYIPEYSYDPGLATRYGWPVACLYKMLEYWIQGDLHHETNLDEEGRAWISYSCSEMAEMLPYLTENQISYSLEILEREELLICKLSPDPMRWGRWYTFPYPCWEKLKMQRAKWKEQTEREREERKRKKEEKKKLKTEIVKTV